MKKKKTVIGELNKEEQLENAKQLLLAAQNARVQACIDEVAAVLEKHKMMLQVAGEIRNPQIIIIPKQ